jgi:RNA polymerase sigma-70 factor (ECF subfamily)
MVYQGKGSKVSDEHLMERIPHGDADAFNELYLRYHKRLLYYFYRMLGNSSEKAQDFLQDIFIKIIDHPESFNISRKFSTWIFSVAHNMCKNEYRRQAVRSNTFNCKNIEQYSIADEGTNQDTRLTADQIFLFIDGMGEIEKTVFILYYREDFSVEEIGKTLDLSEGTVKSKLYYTRKKLTGKLMLQDIKL